jgi:hypothetical protein
VCWIFRVIDRNKAQTLIREEERRGQRIHIGGKRFSPTAMRGSFERGQQGSSSARAGEHYVR